MKPLRFRRAGIAVAFYVSLGPVLTAAGAQAPPERIALPSAVPEITRGELEAHVRTLAADELRGRFTGTPEAVQAADYLARVLAAAGVEPAGDAGTFLQRVPLERRRATEAPELRVTPVQGEPWLAAYGVDFDFPASAPAPTAPLRVLVVREAMDLPAKPDPAVALFVDGTVSERRKLLPRSEPGSGPEWGLQVVRGRTQAGKARTVSTLWSKPDVPGSGPERLELHGALLELAQKGGLATLQLATHAERATLDAFNVVGVLRGRGTPAEPASKDEAVVLSAHYDHLHEMAEAPGADDAAAKPVDRIFNGADDDASGCAAVLEIAGRLAAAPRPARTVVFLFATGEEIGLLGTWHYLDHPPFPLDKTVLNLNFEMVGRPDPKVGGAGKLWLTGFELSNLGPAFASAGLAIVADPHPDQHFFERSDNIAFVRRGIVGQTLSSYGLHKDYHAVSDEAETLDFAHLETGTRAGCAAVELVASGGLRPAWLEGKDPNARAPRRPRREEPK